MPPSFPSWFGVAGLSLAITIVCLTLTWVSGRLVLSGWLHVGYTRKFNHFLLFFLPALLPHLERVTATRLHPVVVPLVVLHAVLFASTPWMLRHSPVCRTIFAALDRPEDRPHTLLWLWSQMVVGYLALIPWLLALRQLGMLELIQIPILINGVGDGLAEVVGVRYGRHRYRVPSFIRDRVYTRSYEGSACVLLTGLGVVSLFADGFSAPQFWAVLATVPLLMTLAEATAPHTWDTPILFTVGGAATTAVVWLL